MADSGRLRLLMAQNPEFAELYRRGDRWATQHAQMVLGIDGIADRKHPERTPKEDGQPRNWCGTCLHPEGCVTCDLENSHEVKKRAGASYRTN